MRFGSIVRCSLLSIGLLQAAFGSTISIGNNGSTVYFQETNGGNSSIVRSLGQTFVVPTPLSENVLTGFSLFFSGTPDAGFDYRAYIFQWDTQNNQATGPALFTSSVRTGAQAPSFSGLNILLATNASYIAILTTQGAANDSFSGALLAHNSNGAVYTSGAAFQQSSGAPNGNTGTGTWNSAAWTGVNGNTDFQFSATFAEGSTVPEPSSLALLAFGVAAVFVNRRRK